MRVLINGFSAVHGGGATVLRDFLEGLSSIVANRSESFLCVAPNREALVAFESPKLSVIDRGRLPYAFNSLTFNEFGVNRFCTDNGIDAIINFGDLVPATRIPQLYFFDWAYLLYPDSLVWKSMSGLNWLQRSLKVHLIRRRLHLPTVIVVQCDAMKRRMQQLSSRDVVTIPSPCRFTDEALGTSNRQESGHRIAKLLVLSGYAPHKNFLLVKRLAMIVKSKGIPITITITVDPMSAKESKAFLEDIDQEGLSSIIRNVGRVAHSEVATLISSHDALLLPTLLESYGLPYVEGMMCGRTILTSDLDFARSVCGDAAYYFDPLSADSALSAILKASDSANERFDKIRKGISIVQLLPTLTESAMQIVDAIVSRLQRSNAGIN